MCCGWSNQHRGAHGRSRRAPSFGHEPAHWGRQKPGQKGRWPSQTSTYAAPKAALSSSHTAKTNFTWSKQPSEANAPAGPVYMHLVSQVSKHASPTVTQHISGVKFGHGCHGCMPIGQRHSSTSLLRAALCHKRHHASPRTAPHSRPLGSARNRMLPATLPGPSSLLI